MIISLIALTMIVFSFNFFSIAFQINGINKVVVATPIAYMENSVPLTGTYAGMLRKSKITSYLTSYYDNNLKKYIKDYTLDLYFYNAENGSYCIRTYCTGVEVTIKANLNFNYKYERTMFYEVYHNYE